MEAVLLLLGGIIAIPLLIIYNIFSWGYVATVIYSWFIVPIYPEAPLLTWMEFGGIMIFLGCFIHSSNEIKDEYRDKTAHWVRVILGPWLLLITAWLFHLIY